MKTRLCVVLALLMCGSLAAELQEVRVGGEIRIRGRHFGNSVNPGAAREARIPGGDIPGRPLGPNGLTSIYDVDSAREDFTFVEQRTLLNISADFTDQVSTFLELESWGRWGEQNANGNEFRSNYVTGVDNRAWTGDDIEIFQAYIQAEEMFGYPVRLRLGRQELAMGDSWLVGARVSPTLGISYDAIRATWTPGDFTIDAWWAKLNETFGDFASDDVDFYGVYSTYAGWEPLSVSPFFLLIHDGRDIASPARTTQDFGSTWLKTAGIRAFGAQSGFDHDLHLAYQWGTADSVGSLYVQEFSGLAATDADYDAWAGDLEFGYTFDTNWRPRVYVGGAYFSGDDNRDVSWAEAIDRNHVPDASLAFNRLFSGWWYTANTDIIGGASAMTNFHQVRAGVTMQPLEKISVGLATQYLGVNDPFDWPDGLNVWNTREADDELGYVAHLWVKYDYSDDLWIRVGWERFFSQDGLQDGSYILQHGHDLLAGTDDDPMDYIYFDTQLKF